MQKRFRYYTSGPIGMFPVLFWLFVSGCATTDTTTVRMHPELEQRVARIEKIAILPVSVGQLLVNAYGENELQLERERSLGQQLTRALKTSLQAKSYTVITEPERWPGDPPIPETSEAQQLRTEFLVLAKQVPKQPVPREHAVLLNANLGALPSTVAAQQQADALLIVRYSGYDKSGGRQAAEIVTSALIAGLTGGVGGPITKSAGEVEVALVDGESGDVLWMNRLAGPTDRKRGAVASRGYYGPQDMASKALLPFPSRAARP